MLVLSIVAFVIVAGLAWTACAPPRQGRSARDRWVSKHPHEATQGDVRRILGRELGPSDGPRVISTVSDLGLTPPQIWHWVERLGAQSLKEVVDSGAGPAEMRRRLSEQGVLDPLPRPRTSGSSSPRTDQAPRTHQAD